MKKTFPRQACHRRHSKEGTHSLAITPTLTEPLEKKLRNDAADIYIDEDEESSYNTIEISKGNDSQNDPIMSMEDEEFASDDEKVRLRGSESVV